MAHHGKVNGQVDPDRSDGELLRLLLASVRDAVIVTDLGGTVTYWNEGAVRLFGWTAEEMLGRPLVDRFPAGQAQVAVADAVRAIAQGAEWRGEFEDYRKDGSRVWIDARVRRVCDEAGRPIGVLGISHDVTDRKRAEQELRESEERFRALMEQAPFSVQIFSPDGWSLQVNRAWEELWGVTSDEMPPYNVLHDAQLEAKGVLPLIRRAFAGQAVRIPAIAYDPNETIPDITRHEDSLRWVAAVAYPLRDGSGQIREVVLVHEDVTAGRRAEDALRQSEARFRLMADSAPVLVWVSDREGLGTYFNRPWLEFTGRTLEQEVGVGWIDCIHPDDREQTTATCLGAIAARQPFQMEWRMRRADGQYRWVLDSGVPFFSPGGQFAGYIGSCIDITERRQAEESLLAAHRELEWRVAERTAEIAQANEFLHALLENVQDGIVACDAEGVLTLFNRATRKFHGLREEPLPAEQWAGRYRLYQPDGRTPMAKEDVPLYRALQGERVRDVEMVIAPEDLPPRTLLASGQAFYDGQGHKLGAVVSMHDVTERKRAEAELLQAKAELERRVEERTAELARANESLRDADRRKDEFLAMLAHELRNPLAPIRSGLDLLALEPGAQAEMIGLMQQQVEHMVRLVDDLLDVSRIIRGRVELRREPVELADLIRRSAAAVQPALEARGQELTVSLPAAALWLDADAVRLVQVIENLLGNASKYTDDGGRIELSAGRDGGEAVIAVQDNGIGIEPELLPAVFDLFTQSARSLDRSQGGLGIGLTLVKSLVQMHGGSVAASSEGMGKGSRFEVRLPVIEPAPPAAVSSVKDTPSAGRRILVVDDNVGAARMLSLLVARLGPHEVETAHDGPGAVETAGRFRPDIVLLDIGLPRMDGLAVARQLRGSGEFDGALLVALTGYGQEEDRRESLAAGFDEHLVKPVDVETLRQLLCHPKLACGDRATDQAEPQ